MSDGEHLQRVTSIGAVLGWMRGWTELWRRFWFQPLGAETLAVIRICTGAMLAYMHVIWLSRQADFFGPQAWINREASQSLHAGDWAWSWFWYADSPLAVYSHLGMAILFSLLMMVGLGTRLVIPLAWFLTLMVCHRSTLALFGLDQVVMMLTMYLSFARSGSVFSLDAKLRDRLGRPPEDSGESWLFPSSKAVDTNRIATRLIQLHLCAIYLFGGLSKMRGEMWYDGSAMWFTIVNYEYQSLDLTWMGRSPLLIATLSGMTIFWETFYSALVWPRLTRPLVLAMAVFVHGGIAIGLGMITFGAIMIVANLAFIAPPFWRRFERVAS
ncbi:MAG: HTTM domain-containing protein [Pirellulaceae bacterium]